MSKTRKTVFVSYARKDRKWVDEFSKFLAPWLRDKRVALWDDSRIEPGDRWQADIENAIDEATVALLLVTKDFLASSFIMERELPLLLVRAERNDIRLIWVAVGYAGVRATKLWDYQAVNDPAKPLESLNRPDRDKAMVKIAKSVADAVTVGAFAGGLRIIDETTEPLEAALAGRPERKDRSFGVQATYEPAENRISFRGAHETITAIDIERLPSGDREFIADLEDSLQRNYKRWSAVRKGLGDAGGALDEEVEQQLTRIAKLMCRDLNSILDFLRQMYKAELEDHYGRYRFICEQLERRKT